MPKTTTETESLNQIKQLLAEIDSVYEQPHHKLTRPDGAEEPYDIAFERITDAWKALRQELKQVFSASGNDIYYSRDPKGILVHLKVHRAWITFLKMLRWEVDILLYQEAPNATVLTPAERLAYLSQAESASMQPREQEDDTDSTPLSDELDRGDALYTPAPRS
jgi:hypothetical protein